MINKIKNSFRCFGFICATMLRFILLNPILLPPSLLSSSISSRDINNAFPFYLLLSPLTLFARSHVIHRAQLHSLRDSFHSIFSYFYRSAYTTSINHHSCTPFSHIFTSDYNFGSFVSPLPDSLPFLPVLFLIFFFSHHWHFIFIFLPYFYRSFTLFCSHLLNVYHFNYSFNLCFFHLNFSCLGFRITFVFV